MFSILRKSSLIALFAVLAACDSGVKLDNVPPPRDAATAATTPNANPNQVATVDVTADPLNDANGPLAKRSVYFDFDSFAVKDEYQSVVTNHAKYLLSHKNRKVIIQGNTDERGGSEYNLALGQKRAEAVRRALSLQGVPDSQMEAVSLGKEKPKALGHDESSWAENRRADLAY